MGLVRTLFEVVYGFVTNGFILLGLMVGAIGYSQFGLQPRIIGWVLAPIALVIVWQTGLWSQWFELVAAVNLLLLALLSVFYQMKDEDAVPDLQGSDTLGVRDVFLQSGGRFTTQVSFWTNFSTSAYSVWGGLAIAFILLGGTGVAEVPFYGLATMASILVSLRFSGGTRGKLWETIGDALQVKGGIIPQPSSD